MLQLGLIFIFTIIFLVIERVRPGRDFGQIDGWYKRALFLNACQLAITILAGLTWNRWLQGGSIFHIGVLPDIGQGFFGWFIGTFVFYWWHRARHHSNFLWRVFHQIHHSATRIEVLTSFYKHPVEIGVDSFLASLFMFPVLGASVQGAAWFNVFAAIGEYFYHANLKTPRWVGYFIQRPEQHSIHHQYNVHNYNYADLPIWDKMFGTYRDTETFIARCGFPEGKEERLARMMLFKENYND